MPESTEIRYRFQESIPPALVDVRSLPQTELKALAGRLLSALSADGVAIAVAITANTENMICTVSSGNIAPPVGALLDFNSGISGQCVREKRTLYSHDTATDSRVDKDACDRLGIRSVVVSPILHDSASIGILEIFSGKAEAFDEGALTTIEEEARRAAWLIKLEEPSAESRLVDHEKWKERSGLFLVDKGGRLSQTERVVQEVADEATMACEDKLALPKFLSPSPASADPRRWIALAIAVVTTAILGFMLIRFVDASGTGVPKIPSPPNALANGQVATRELPTMSGLVSDAAPPVRMLMAKAIAGNSAAQASLAEHYIAGNGVTRDRVKAVVWFVIAGAGGDREASRSAVRIMQNLQPFETDQVHFNLGTMFRDGIGTSRNLIAAYSWFSLAQAAGDVRATPALLNLEQVMKPTEVAEARRRAAAWTDSHRTSASNLTNEIPPTR